MRWRTLPGSVSEQPALTQAGGRSFFDAPATPEPQTSESPGTSIWKLARRHKLLLISSSIACAVAAFALSTAQSKVYIATVAIEIQAFNDNVLNTGDTDTVARDTNSGDSYFATEIESLSATALLARVSDRLKLESRFQTPPPEGPFNRLLTLLHIPHPVLTPRERAINELRDGMTVTVPKDSSRIVRVSYAADDPKVAAQVANTIADAFIDRNTELRLSEMRKTSSWLSQQIEDLRERLQESQRALENFGNSAGLVFTSDKDNIAEAKLKQLQDELSKAQAERIEKQSRREMMAHTGDAPSELLDSGPLREYQIKYADAKQRLAELEATFTANHPKVLQTRAEVAAIQASMDAERRNVSQRIASEFEASQRREQLLLNAFNAQTRLVTSQEAQTARYMLLKNEVETNRQLYDSMLQKVKSLNIASAMRARNIMVVDAAEPPSIPSQPKPLPSAGVGMITGLLISGVFVLARERSNQSIQSPGLMQKVLQVPELGVIPSFPKQTWFARSSLSLLPNRSAGSSLELITLNEGDSPIADSYRAVVASLVFGKARSSHGNALVITSAMPAEGKTTALCNLGIVLTRINLRVLVIDADFRKPRLSTVFGVRHEHGLTDILKSSRDLPEYLPEELVIATMIPGISILSIGSNCDSGDVDLLHSPRLRQIIDRVKREFDFVLIDTPPVIPVPDARIIGRQVDGVILICRASATSSEALVTASRRLQADGTRVVGTILNDFDATVGGHYYASSRYDSGN